MRRATIREKEQIAKFLTEKAGFSHDRALSFVDKVESCVRKKKSALKKCNNRVVSK